MFFLDFSISKNTTFIFLKTTTIFNSDANSYVDTFPTKYESEKIYFQQNIFLEKYDSKHIFPTLYAFPILNNIVHTFYNRQINS